MASSGEEQLVNADILETVIETLIDCIRYQNANQVISFINTLPGDITGALLAWQEVGDDGEVDQGRREAKAVGSTPGPAAGQSLQYIVRCLHAACRYGKPDVVCLLLSYGADPRHATERDGTAFDVATTYGQLSVIQKLIEFDSDFGKDEELVKELLVLSCQAGHRDVAEFWLDALTSLKGAEPVSADDFIPANDPLTLACQGGHYQLASYLVKKKVSVVTEETADRTRESFRPLLESWCQPLMSDPPQEPAEDQESLEAKWSHRCLAVFADNWLTDSVHFRRVLVRVNLSHNALRAVPETLVWGLPSLKSLDLSHNQILKLPSPSRIEMVEGSRLMSLKLQHNQLALPVLDVFMLASLETLDLSKNRISSLNPERFRSNLYSGGGVDMVWNSKKLQTLNLSHNQILRFPRNICGATGLTRLNVSNNKLVKLPAPWQCPLVSLNASSNQIPDIVLDLHGHWDETLTTLDLSQNQLEQVPWTICQLTCLKELNLADNRIAKLPSPSVWTGHSLAYLNLAGNRLSSPEEPSVLSPHTKRTSKIWKRSSTKEAGPSATVFYLPAAAATAAATAAADPAPTATVVFPEIHSDSLRSLDLSGNQLGSVPVSVLGLMCLRKLDLSRNPIAKLPDKLAQLTNLESLVLAELTIREPDGLAELAMAGGPTATRDILDKLSKRMLKCRPQSHMKLMLVGPKRCGKTSLLQCLTEKTPSQDLGINVSSWTLSRPLATRNPFRMLLTSARANQEHGGGQIKFSTWDLKGGEMKSAITQSFLTPRALYLLVLNLLDHTDGLDAQLRPWLLNIQMRAPESALIVVLTHSDVFRGRAAEVQAAIVESYRPGDGFPRINAIVEVTATGTAGQGIQELRQAIYSVGLDMTFRKRRSPFAPVNVRLIGRMVPHTFEVLREVVIKEKSRRQRSLPPLPPVLKEDELVSLIKKIPESTIKTQQDIEEATKYLISCGSLLHFGDHLQGLTSLYFLDPVWLYDVLLTAVNVAASGGSAIRQGRLRLRSLRDLYQGQDFGLRNFEEILQLLQRLEIVLPIGNSEFLVPSCLPRDMPGQDHLFAADGEAPFRVLERLYKLPYTPPGFWVRLVSRIYVFLRTSRQEGTAGSRRQQSVSRARSRRRLERRISSNQSIRRGLQLAPTNIMYCQQGLSAQHSGGHIQLEPTTFPDAKPGICIRVHCTEGKFTPMGFLVDVTENLIKEWYPGLLGVDNMNRSLVERLIPCPVCKVRTGEGEGEGEEEGGGPVHHFPIGDLGLAAVSTGARTATCPRHPEKEGKGKGEEGGPLALATLVPDLFLEDLPVRMLGPADFDFDPQRSAFLQGGGFGQVYRARFRGTEEVAVKMFVSAAHFRRGVSPTSASSSSESYSAEERSPCGGGGGEGPSLLAEGGREVGTDLVMRGFSNLRQELAVMCRLRHPCIIALRGASIRYLCFAMELAPGGDLAGLLWGERAGNRRGASGAATAGQGSRLYGTCLDRTLTYKVALQVAAGVAYIHRRGYIHSDLKTDNVLVWSLDPGSAVNVKLTDLGIARPLDLQGARGQAGPMGFCAPEILRGRTFTQEVDWFSYGMLLYHLMAGVWPYDHLKSAIDIRQAVSIGEKPRFEFRDHAVVPLFPHLEGLMRQCWSNNPEERPRGTEIAQRLRDASFACLMNIIQLDTEAMTFLHAGCGGKSGRLWFWTGEGESRQSTKIHIKYFCKEELSPTRCSGARVNCMLQVGRWELVGTKDECLELYCPPAVGPQQNVFQKDLRFSGEVLCLCYQPVQEEETLGYLYAGLRDGRLAILKHTRPAAADAQGAPTWPETSWAKAGLLTLENRPCTHLMLVAGRKELWIACGNKLRIMSTQVRLLDSQPLVVSDRPEYAIGGLAHRGDSLFCFLAGSSQVLQYSMAGRQRLHRFQCWRSLLEVSGSCTVLDKLQEGEEEEEERAEEERAEEEEVSTSSEPADDDSPLPSPLDDDKDQAIRFRESYFGRTPSWSLQQQQQQQQPHRSQCATLPATPPRVSAPHIRPHSASDCLQLPASDPASVQAILVVRDTLWVGTSSGKILVICLGDSGGAGFGEVLAMLAHVPEAGKMAGPLHGLVAAGEDHVVSSHRLPAWLELGTAQQERHRYQLLVWQAWGSEEIRQFEAVHRALDRVEESTADQ